MGHRSVNIPDVSVDHVEVGHDLARHSGIDLSNARRCTQRLWEARGFALVALSRGDLLEAEKIMQPFKRKQP